MYLRLALLLLVLGWQTAGDGLNFLVGVGVAVAAVALVAAAATSFDDAGAGTLVVWGCLAVGVPVGARSFFALGARAHPELAVFLLVAAFVAWRLTVPLEGPL